MAAANLTGAHPWSPKNEKRARDVLPVGAGVVLQVGSRVGWETTSGANKGYLVKYDQTSADNGIVYLGTYDPTIGAQVAVDNTAGAAGALTAEVAFHRERYFVWWDNDTVHTCAAADRGSAAYAESDHEAGNTAGSLSKIGLVYKIGIAGEGSGGMVLIDITGNP